MDFGKVIFFAPSLGTKGSYSTLPERLKMTTTYSNGKKQVEDKGVGEVDLPCEDIRVTKQFFEELKAIFPHFTNLYKTGNAALEASLKFSSSFTNP